MDDLARLDELEDLFGHSWDALVLVCLLNDGSLRYRQLGEAMQRRAHRRVPDSNITSSLNNLTHDGLVTKVRAADGGRTRAQALTEPGRQKAQRILATLAILDHHSSRSDRTNTPGPDDPAQEPHDRSDS